MHDFDGQAKLHRTLCKDRPPLRSGMVRTIKDLQFRKLLAPRPRLAKLDWDALLRRWVTWFDTLLESHPPPTECEVLWLETPSILESLATSAAAYKRLGPASDSYGTEDDCVWPGKDFPPDDCAFEIPELSHVIPNDEEVPADDDDLFSKALTASLTISHALMLLLALHGLPRTSVCSRLTHPSGVSVLIGPKSGGVMPVGQLFRNKWSPIRRAKPAPIVLARLSDESRMFMAKFQPKRFVSLGGDINERDSTGRTALLRSSLAFPREIKALLDAGADAMARDQDGEGVLHVLGATEIGTLRLLIKRGADPRGVNAKGWSVLDRLVWDGRCTAKHLKFYESLGVRLPKQGDRMTHAMACACSGVAASLPRKRGVLRHIMALGHDINARDEKGRTPLWLVLEKYAQYVASYHARPESAGEDRVAETFLSFGADPNTRHPTGILPFIPRDATPLMVRRYDDARLVKALLKHGADPFARCAEGRTALDYAKEGVAEPPYFGNQGAEQCVAVLERAMKSGRSRTR